MRVPVVVPRTHAATSVRSRLPPAPAGRRIPRHADSELRPRTREQHGTEHRCHML
ncbi:hypothetical protein SLNWT_6802 [Streptomyces albus]|uniref:Uncharacterized protein n=1 Tax=Streptomyces albus (strain ATCC 21838 / DSM 41398 / FERM P-419 / JCM 4703 / NBRC 107858) TaxID=1081613 RepID=A0A0B5EWH9_STRA4|nr:hypothetical protein SLNWT_6802 [Streptomyces albus]AOU81482.1 hypothetical protein SLNHY_6791 [Streptomyces albus]